MAARESSILIVVMLLMPLVIWTCWGLNHSLIMKVNRKWAQTGRAPDPGLPTKKPGQRPGSYGGLAPPIDDASDQSTICTTFRLSGSTNTTLPSQSKYS